MDNLHIQESVGAILERSRSAQDRLQVKGRYLVEQIRDGVVIDSCWIDNLVTNEGKNKLWDVMFRNQTPIATWYIGLIDNAGFSAVAPTDVMNSHAGWTEFDDYTEAVRQTWVVAAAASQAISNSGTPAIFTVNATGAVRGIFVTSVSTKNGTTGVLWSGALFTASLTVANGDSIKITYTVSA
jgi:hypothetical protein